MTDACSAVALTFATSTLYRFPVPGHRVQLNDGVPFANVTAKFVGAQPPTIEGVGVRVGVKVGVLVGVGVFTRVVQQTSIFVGLNPPSAPPGQVLLQDPVSGFHPWIETGPYPTLQTAH
jgi:hypothetical protein